jgi:hypothetical protein
MSSVHLSINFGSQTEHFLSESHEVRGSVTVVTVTSTEWFAAEKSLFRDREEC